MAPNPLKLNCPGLFGNSLLEGESISCDVVHRQDGFRFAINVAGPRSKLPPGSPNNHWTVGKTVNGSNVSHLLNNIK